MSREFKLKDKVRPTLGKVNNHGNRIPRHSEAEIVEIDEYFYYIKYNNDIWRCLADELELIPKYKNLKKLWKESGNEPIKVFTNTAINGKGVLLQIYENTAIIASNPHDPETYLTYDATIEAWQLYQEPSQLETDQGTIKNNRTAKKVMADRMFKDCRDLEKASREEKPAEKCDHKNTEVSFNPVAGVHNFILCKDCGVKLEEETPTVKKSLSVEKCEHKKAVKHIGTIFYECRDCGIKLEEKWLWYIKGEVVKFPVLSKFSLTVQEASDLYGDLLIKKASNSRELFEV